MRKIILSALLLLPFGLAAQNFSNPLAIPYTLSGPSFNLTIKDTVKAFTPGNTSNTFSYNDMDYLGPTLLFEAGEIVDFNILNRTAGETATVHWHGFHIPAKWDGGPMNTIAPGATWSPTFEVKEHASTMWYHSHLHGSTNEQVSLGMAGLIIIRDSIESSLNLPRTYGNDDFPLIIQDKNFNGAGQLEVDLLGANMMINGTLDAHLELPAQVNRLRLLNASTERVYMLGMDDNRTFSQIGTDGGLLEAPVQLNRLPLAPGERAEILLDLSNATPGNVLHLMSYSTEFLGSVAGSCNNGPGCGTGPLDSTDFQIMQFRVVAQTTNPVTSIPANLTTINYIPTTTIDTTRTKELRNPANPGDPFTIDGTLYDHNVINDIVTLGNTEIWRFVNTSQIAHPMHIHDVQFNILDRDGNPPPANEQGWKDVVLVYPDETVRVIAQFNDFADSVYTYMYHCHSLGHEDNGMMGQFLVVSDGSTISVDPQVEEIPVQLYPNPATGTVWLDIPEARASEIRVIDNQGKVLVQIQEPAPGKTILQVGDLPAGIYSVNILFPNQMRSRKLIITK